MSSLKKCLNIRNKLVSVSEFEHLTSRIAREILTNAGAKRDSTWSVKECMKLPGRRQNRTVMRIQLVRKSSILSKKKKVPVPVIQDALNDTYVKLITIILQ